MPRAPLSTFVNGSFLPIDAFAPTLVHTDTLAEKKYVRVSGFNRGRKARAVVVDIDGVPCIHASVQPTGSFQLLVPNLPLYNSPEAGIDVHVAVRHQQQPGAADAAAPWTLPSAALLASAVQLDADGRVVGLAVQSFAATADAQPILVVVEDARRSADEAGGSADDVDPAKGSEAIVELSQQNGSIGVEVIRPGHNFAQEHLRARVTSGLFVVGSVLIS